MTRRDATWPPTLVEQLAELGELGAERRHLGLEPVDAPGQAVARNHGEGSPFCDRGARQWPRRRRGVVRRGLADPPKQLREPVLLLAGPALKPGGVSLPSERLQHFVDPLQGVEPDHPLGPALELSGRLRAAEEEHTQDRQLGLVDAERLLGQMAVLDRAAGVAAGQSGQPVAREPLGRLTDGVLVVVDDRLAVGRLVAREPERVERQGVLVGGGEPLLDQAPQEPAARAR